MYQYKIAFKVRGEAPVYMPAHMVDAQGLREKFMKSDEVVSFGETMFRCSDIRRVDKEWVIDYKAQDDPHQIVELSEEDRQKNTRRLRWIRTYIASYRLGQTLEDRISIGQQNLSEDERQGYETFVRWYHSPKQEQRRALKDEFRKQHFDVYYTTQQNFDKAFTLWQAKQNQPSLAETAEEVFGVSAS